MKLNGVLIFCKGLLFCLTCFLIGHVDARRLNLITLDKHYLHIENDSISYQQLVENSPKATIEYLNIPYTPKAKYHIKHLRRQLKKTLKEYPNLATKNISNDFLINEIEQSTRFMKEEKGRKTALKIILGIIAVVLVIRTLNTIKKSN